MAKNDVIILVERETFEMEGKVYYSYFIKGTIRGRDVRAAVVPPDKGAMQFLISYSVTLWQQSFL